VLVLQNSKDSLKGELGSYSKTCATSTADGNEAIGIEAESVLDIMEEKNEGPTTKAVIKTEPHVSYVPMFTVMHISYKLYPELSAHVSVCPCETNILH
jgi:hypothetical protein